MSFDEIFDLTAGWSVFLFSYYRLDTCAQTNTVDSSTPKVSIINSVMYTEFHRCLVLSPSMRVTWYEVYSFRAQNKAERHSPVDPGINREVTDLYPSRASRVYTPRGTRDRSILISTQLAKLSFDRESFSIDLTAS